jgi:hypothetical protein
MSFSFTLLFSLLSISVLILIYSIRARRKTVKVSALFFWQEEIARENALALLDNFQGPDVMIMSSGKPAGMVLPFSSDRAEIRKAINDLAAEDTAADIQEAVLKIKPYFRDGDNIYLFSDGAFSNLSSIIDKTPNLSFVPSGQTGENTGIQTLDIFRQEYGGYVTAGVSLKNFGSSEISSTVDLLHNGKVIDAKRIEIPSGEEKDIYFHHAPSVPGNITAILNHNDPFTPDNYRYAVQSLPVPRSVLLVTKNNFFLKRFLEQLENHDVTVMDTGAYEKNIIAERGKNYDTCIYDNYVSPVEMCRASVYINPGQNIHGVSWGTKHMVPEDLYALREHPVMLHTDFSDVRIRRSRMVRSFEGLALLWSSGSPLIIVSDQQYKKRIIFGFDIMESNFPVSVNFPVFFTNLLNWLDPYKDDGEKNNIYSGDAFIHFLPEKPGAGTKAVVESPDGRETSVDIDEGRLIFSDTGLAGIYKVMLGNREMEFAVNIRPSESDIKPAGHYSYPEELKGSGSIPFLSSFKVWKVLGILALLLLLSEKRLREKLLS